MARKLSRQLLLRIARARFEPLNRGKQLKPYGTIIRELADDAELKGFDAAAVSNAIREAIERRLVTVAFADERNALPSVQRNDVLEELLLESFHARGLRTAIVVDVESELPSGRQARDDESVAPDDAASKSLGVAFGDYLSDARLITDGMKLGIGAGRSIFHVCQQVKRRRRIVASGLQLYALTGHLGKRISAEENLLIDSDDNLSAFALGVSRKCELEKLGVFAILDEQGSELGRTWMKDGAGKRPDVLLVGAGALSREWVFYDALVRNPDEGVKQQVDELSELVKKVREANDALDLPYFPVGDVGCRLQYLPLRSAKMTEGQEGKIKRLVRDLNARLATVPEAILKDSRLWVVAGSGDGTGKARIILHALESFQVDCLTTDARTAAALIELAAGRG